MEAPFFQFSNLLNFSEIFHGMSTRSYGNMKIKDTASMPEVIDNRKHFCETLGINMESAVVAGLTHSNNVTLVDEKDKGKGIKNPMEVVNDSDALVTNKKGVFLMITVADCLPILAYDPVNRVVGIAHAGWRSIVKGIIPKFLEKFEQFGTTPDNLIIGIGPSICQRHFVVKNDVREQFASKHPRAVFVRNHDGYVDLKKCAVDELIKKGAAKANLEVARECTICNHYYYSSFRSEKDNTIFQAAIIGMREK